ncbi:MAG TPA: hypothetical protein VER04_17075, partial [Polyangiaceae bacterium]|nr:hypothetical protein [Polyangiaceae bacterium]
MGRRNVHAFKPFLVSLNWRSSAALCRSQLLASTWSLSRLACGAGADGAHNGADGHGADDGAEGHIGAVDALTPTQAGASVAAAAASPDTKP